MKTNKKLLSVLSVGLLVATAVSCGEKGPSTQDTLNAAISKLILTQNNKDVITNFAVAAVLKYEGVTYTIDWTSSNTTVAAVLPNSDTLKTINVTRPAAGEEDVDVVLTAKISATEGSSTYYASKEFNIRVLALEATAGTESISDLKTAIQDIDAAAKALATNFGSRQLTVVSILTGKGILVADSTDVIYVYGSSYATELAVGDNITIQECKAYRNYGCPQITNMTYTKVSSGNANPAPINSALTVESLYQALAAAGNDGNAMDANLFGYFTVTAKVLLVEDKYIVLADPSNPDDQSKWLGAYNYNTDYAELKKVVDATVTVNVHLHDVYSNFNFGGSTPSATIFRVNYFGGPIDADLDDATVAANTLNAAVSGIKTSYENETTITLDSEITWSLSAGANTSVFALSGNTLKLTPGSAEATATLTAKVTLNGTDYTKDVTITVAAASTDLTPATTLETGKAYKLSFTTTDGVQCFLKATLSGKYNNYIDTASTAAEGLDFYLEAATTGYYIYTTISGTKTYLGTVPSGTFTNPTFVTADPTAWLWDATKGVFTTLDGAFFLGGNGTHTTGGLYAISNLTSGQHTKTSCYIYTGAPAGGDTGGDVGGDTGEAVSVNEALALSFTCANKASGDDYFTTNYPNWTKTARLGATYLNYLGFGRTSEGHTADSNVSIKSPAFAATSDFRITVVLKGNASNNDPVVTSTLTFELVDATGAVVATGKVVSDSNGVNAAGTTAISPKHNVDSTFVIEFEYVSGKTVTDATNLKITFAKAKANIGLKTLAVAA